MLHTAAQLPVGDGAATHEALNWVLAQLRDDHEAVRAQAAWTMALRASLDDRQIGDLYKDATDLSAPALAAAAGRQVNPKISGNLAKAIRDDSPLIKEAYEWALSLTQPS
jgi:hypothetical protein